MSEWNEKLLLKKKNVYADMNDETKATVFAYADGYKSFLDRAKTEREAVVTAIAMAEANGFREYRFGDPIRSGDCFYYNNRGKNLLLFRVGKEDLNQSGIRILAAHVDSPRLDLKQCPVYEDGEMCFLKTHYYGGIKKYQWTTIPLALHGVITRLDGTVCQICIGEADDDPVFYINDLLPHLSQEQYKQTLKEAIPGESLNILVGGMPLAGEEKDAIKLNVLRILNETYGITEDDFLSAEISAVPAYRARDIGFDRALIGGYGHDDRVCSYPALTALFDEDHTDATVIVVLADKEEIGSEGNTGMQSVILDDLISAICDVMGADSRAVRSRSICLSADVNAAYDPNFKNVYEKANSAILSCGTALSKYTGSFGKSGSNDASSEFVGYVRRVFHDGGVVWQASELGKVDQGGGGTVAKYISKMNIDVVDIGVPVIAMHAPFEVISKADLYMTYLGFRSFLR